MSHSHVYQGIESNNNLQVQRAPSQGGNSTLRLRDPYNDDGIVVMINKSRLPDPELEPCSSGSDDDSSEATIDDVIDRMFSQLSHSDRFAATTRYSRMMTTWCFLKTRRRTRQ